MPEDYIRVVRVLEYSGPRDWVERTLDRSIVRGVRGEYHAGTSDHIIKEVYVSADLGADHA